MGTMDEPQRVQLTCLSTATSLHPPAPKRPRIEEKGTPATVRLTLTLIEPDHKRCSEFYYPELLRSSQSREKRGQSGEKVRTQKKVPNLINEDAAESKEVAEIAQKFEEKYGCKKKRQDRMQDLIDMGYGYDETDSFIDNSEAYDELVPASLSTKYGGFYINSGTLQFRQASESEDEKIKEKKKKSPKKMKERGDKVKKKKREEEKKSKKTKHPKPGFTALNGAKEKKKKQHSVSYNEMIKQFQQEKDAQNAKSAVPSSPLTVKSSSTSAVKPSLAPSSKTTSASTMKIVSSPSIKSSPLTTLKVSSSPTSKLSPSPAVKTSPSPGHKFPPFSTHKTSASPIPKAPPALKPAPSTTTMKTGSSLHRSSPSPTQKPSIPSTSPPIPAPTLKEAEPISVPCLPTIVHDKQILQAASATDSLNEKVQENLCKQSEKQGGNKQALPDHGEDFKKPTTIPEGLPSALEKRIKELSKAVKVSNGDNKTILFTQEMNSALLDIYLLSRDLSSALRSSVFTHLSSVIPCNKETLVKWACHLHVHKESGKLREPLSKLKEAVARAIPEQINKYHEECKVHNQAKYARMLEEEKEQKLGSEDEEEEEKGGRKSAGPRKKFKWNEEIRTLFKESRRICPQLSSILLKNKVAVQQKLNSKDSSHKHVNKSDSPPSETPGPPGAVSISTKDASAPVSSPSLAAASPLLTYSQDNSLDGDLIHNPPSLETVSAHLTTVSNRTGGFSFDFPSSPLLEKTLQVEEKKKQCPPPSQTISSNSLQPPKGFLVDTSMTLAPDKKTVISNQSLKSSEIQQEKQKQNHHMQLKTPQLSSPSLQPSVKLYQINSQHTKGSFPHSTLSGSPRSTVLSPPQRPVISQAKPSKPQGFHLTSSNSLHKPIMSPGLVVKQPGKPSSTVQQVYRPPVPRNPVPPSSSPGTANGQNLTLTVSMNQPPPSHPRNTNIVPNKKPIQPPQKLTLVAPQHSGGGTHGVAKLLTSPNINQSTKSVISSPLITSSTSLTVLTPSYKHNGAKIQGPTPIRLLTPPSIHPFPLHVLSFTADPSPKPGPSKDAVVTGPAPGTFNHGLSRNLVGGLQANTAQPSTAIPHQTVSSHLQPGQTGNVGLPHVYGYCMI
ncbi:ubinuclein-1 [Bombina bombina]|uniref:ubinuclein-1 n=1 Tax=Bombina bombina TaxID=8345 RepID=UPI00235A774B|nr:ubinuclein-1 [Bombina bombina]